VEFRGFLPILPSGHVWTRLHRAAIIGWMGTQKHVLVVDDEPAILRFVRIALSNLGYKVSVATSGEEGLRLAREVSPDIVLLDVLMVPMNGFDVLEKLRTFSRAPVIMFSARTDLACKAIERGAAGFVEKPFRPEDLADKILAVLDESKPGTATPVG